MTLFDRHERCVGIRLFKGKRTFVQLWFCPSGYVVKPHSHDEQSIELMYLCGKTTFFRLVNREYCEIQHHVEQQFTPRWYHVFRRFSISRGQVHWFRVSNWPLVFVNFATFECGREPVSAAIDFNPTNE